ncbi:MAG: hypothetical protein ACRD9R_11795, partial [Pyrinomonadaceae bacterium]
QQHRESLAERAREIAELRATVQTHQQNLEGVRELREQVQRLSLVVNRIPPPRDVRPQKAAAKPPRSKKKPKPVEPAEEPPPTPGGSKEES